MKIIAIPAINGLGKTLGTETAPTAIIRKLKEEISLNESGQKPEIKFEQIQLEKNNPTKNNQLIEEHIASCEEIPIIIGGDHSITYPCFKAFSKKFPNAGLIVFDAHPDTVNNFNPPTHEDYLRVLIEEGHLKKENIILVGTRSWCETEYRYIKSNKIHCFSMREISFEGTTDVCDAVMSISKGFGAVYISIDIDAVDPGFAPATGYIEPGGLTSRELLYFLTRLKNLKNLKAFDLVEINPTKDTNGMTVKLGAKIISELLT